MPITASMDTINPPVTPWPAAPQLVPLELAHTNERVPVVGLSTEVPGLIITPAITGTPPTFTGGWTLTHHATGRYLVANLSRLPLAYLAEAARFLHRRQPDPRCWVQPPTATVADTTTRRIVGELAVQVSHASAGNRPIWWERDSWQTTATNGDDRLVWSLRCAAPLCTTGPADGPASVYDWDENDEPFPFVRFDRADVAAEAEGWQWRQYDETHWLCPDCATAHQATHHPH